MVLKSKYFALLILAYCYGELCAVTAGTKILSRRKRYVAFPEGSSFSVSLHCLFKKASYEGRFAIRSREAKCFFNSNKQMSIKYNGKSFNLKQNPPKL